MTLRSADAPGYVNDLIREANVHLQRAHALLDSAEQIMAALADGVAESL